MDKTKPRSLKACDRCRLKKVKCDGSYPCIRCTRDEVACIFGSRGKGKDQVVSISHAELLQTQNDILKQALKAIWSRYAVGSDTGLGENATIHDICQVAGVLDYPKLARLNASQDGEESTTMDSSNTSEHGPHRRRNTILSGFADGIEDLEVMDGIEDGPNQFDDWPNLEGLPDGLADGTPVMSPHLLHMDTGDTSSHHTSPPYMTSQHTANSVSQQRYLNGPLLLSKSYNEASMGSAASSSPTTYIVPNGLDKKPPSQVTNGYHGQHHNMNDQYWQQQQR